MHSEICTFLNEKVSGCNATTTDVEVGDQTVFVEAAKIKEVCSALKDSDWDFNVLQVITGCDYEDRIELSYIIASFTNNHELILKLKVERGTNDNLPEVESVCDLWKSANFLERETYDMIGVTFKNHPDHRRILCPYDWEGHPLRKDYVVQKEWNGLEVNPAHKVNTHDHEYGSKMKESAEDPKTVMISWKE